MGQMENPVRYSVITEKNPREIVMLRGSGCRFLRCRFCDYHLDSSRDQAANDRINKEALSHVTGQYHSLEVINSGSFLELSEETMAEIERVCLEKHITQLRFEIHWMYREHVKKWREHFAEKGITVKIKMGVETFDDAFRREVFDKGPVHAIRYRDRTSVFRTDLHQHHGGEHVADPTGSAGDQDVCR